jgi:hypothetical protein
VVNVCCFHSVLACVFCVQVTLQYCIWDQWKEVAATPPRRLLCLAGLVGHLLGAFVLPLSIVKPVGEGHLFVCLVCALVCACLCLCM